MNAEDELLLRREVRAAVFRTERLRRAGRDVEADEQLASEIAGAQARLAAAEVSDPAAILLRWRMEDDAALAIAHLIGEIVTEGLSVGENMTRRIGPGSHESAQPHRPATPTAAFPDPPTGVPGLADLLDEMLSQERRARPRPS
ncbi:MAG TPA: hypothetical protein VK163_12505 [Opitutaceae bacterium]|nr:hypothetical protein [Opitutaceae bacterium]